MSMKIFRTAKTKVGSLMPSKTDKPQSSKEGKVSKEEISEQESSLGDIFKDVYGESGKEVKPGDVSAKKPHIRRDDEPDDIPEEEKPAARKYSGKIVQEGVNPTRAAEVESSELDDLISQVLDVPAADVNPQQSNAPTSTPSKDDGDTADFGDGLSLIMADGEAEENAKPTEQEDGNINVRAGASDRTSVKPMPYRGTGKPASSGGSSSITTTTSKISYSSKFVPSIPESFYKEIQSRLEDLIFKFECLDNEYAALQKISHNIHGETLEIKKQFTRED